VKCLFTTIFIMCIFSFTYATSDDSLPGYSTLVSNITVTSDAGDDSWAVCASDSHSGGHHCSNWYQSASTESDTTTKTYADHLEPGLQMENVSYSKVTFESSCLSGPFALSHDHDWMDIYEAYIPNPKDGATHTFSASVVIVASGPNQGEVFVSGCNFQ